MATVVRDKITGVEQTYTTPATDALISAAMIEDGQTQHLTDRGKRRFYNNLIINNRGKLRLSNWEVVSTEENGK